MEFTPATCEPHVLAETKKPFVFPVEVTVGDGEPVVLDLPVDDALRSSLERPGRPGLPAGLSPPRRPENEDRPGRPGGTGRPGRGRTRSRVDARRAGAGRTFSRPGGGDAAGRPTGAR